jgi:alginate O-acetyltransferase complex protein AlgI
LAEAGNSTVGWTILNYILCVLLLVSATMIHHTRTRQVLLLAASYLFYSSFGTAFSILLAASSLFNYGYGLFLRRKPTLARLWGGIGANVLLLAFFKTTHILASLAGIQSAPGKFLDGLIMPLGISFWTFQALSYLFDTYRQDDFDPTLLEFCLYLAFWPSVVMGPICRLEKMLPQFRKQQQISGSDLLLGSKRVLVGLFMKLVVSQLLVSGLETGGGVAAGFDRAVRPSSGLDVWFLAIGFGLQLFFDFAGYSHIVIGLARIFGFSLTENFDAPFMASTPSEFWNRWHMSLSSWIRDYVFMPVASARRNILWRYFALLFSMTLFGLWHGAKGTFVLWGIYQGLLLIAHRALQQTGRAVNLNPASLLREVSSWGVTFLAVSLGWILFRANGVIQAASMFRSVLAIPSYFHPTLASSYYVLVLAVFFGYVATHMVSTFVLPRTLARVSANLRIGMAQWGFTRGFATFIALIPLIAILFLGVLMTDSGSEGVSTFVYAVF